MEGDVRTASIELKCSQRLTKIYRDRLGGHVIVKSVDHFRLQNERDVLVRFQSLTPHIRPLLDEVNPDTESHALVMRWLDGDLLDATKDRQLSSPEVKLVAKGVLEALKVLHADGFVHTGELTALPYILETEFRTHDRLDVKPNNVLVNYADDSKQRITEVQLADFGSTVSEESGHAKDGDDISTPIFRSPEAAMQLPWTTATDIWSFGITVRFLFRMYWNILN
jgi:serine/threonine protein kinase